MRNPIDSQDSLIVALAVPKIQVSNVGICSSSVQPNGFNNSFYNPTTGHSSD